MDVLYSYIGADGALMEFAVQKLGSAGLVVATFATGRLMADMDETAKRLIEQHGTVVVRAHRGGVGRIQRDEAGVAQPKIVEGDNLTPQKARLLLMFALTKTRTPDEIQRIFDTY